MRAEVAGRVPEKLRDCRQASCCRSSSTIASALHPCRTEHPEPRGYRCHTTSIVHRAAKVFGRNAHLKCIYERTRDTFWPPPRRSELLYVARIPARRTMSSRIRYSKIPSALPPDGLPWAYRLYNHLVEGQTLENQAIFRGDYIRQ